MFLLPFRSSQAEIEWPSNLHPSSTEPANQDYTIAKYFLGNLKGGTSEHRTKFKMVPATGLEPVRCYSLEPESSASANSATRAQQFRPVSNTHLPRRSKPFLPDTIHPQPVWFRQINSARRRIKVRMHCNFSDKSFCHSRLPQGAGLGNCSRA